MTKRDNDQTYFPTNHVTTVRNRSKHIDTETFIILHRCRNPTEDQVCVRVCVRACVRACVLCTGQAEIKTVFLESGFIRNNQDPDLQSWVTIIVMGKRLNKSNSEHTVILTVSMGKIWQPTLAYHRTARGGHNQHIVKAEQRSRVGHVRPYTRAQKEAFT